ncbi:MAG: SMC-Scp complex subunit ScpB [Nocardioides sp.]|uniref:SMC-Scp complex subunit ScpB n=1 Tax=Nocardioides sp. TaxID=35761 RepID=UPI0039E225ED
MSEQQTDPGPVTPARPAPAGDETLGVPLTPSTELRPALEAVLMVADEPLDPGTLAAAVGHPRDEVEGALAGLAAEYAEQRRGFDLRNVAGGWRYYTREDFAPVVEAFVLDGQRARLTQAALETLAVVAYKQPISRARVSAIRGVNVDGVMRTLLTRGLVEEAGQDGETGANLYRTTGYFLERIGITGLDDLPELAPYLPEMDELGDELAELAADGSASSEDRTGAEHTGDRAETDGE